MAMRRGTASEPVLTSDQATGLMTPFRGLSLAEHLAGLTLLLAVVLPPLATRLASNSVDDGWSPGVAPAVERRIPGGSGGGKPPPGPRFVSAAGTRDPVELLM